MMVVLFTEGGMCYLGINYDTASITEPELFARCLHEGFDEVLALEHEPPAPPADVGADETTEEVAGQSSSPTMRLPGSVAEVDASPRGPDVAAFFDLDGTLIAGYSARFLGQERMRSRELGLSELVRTIGVAVGAGLGRAGFEDLLEGRRRGVAGPGPRGPRRDGRAALPAEDRAS